MGSRFRETTRELSVTRGHAEQAERLAVAGELAASLAHELRNPLTSIKLLLQLCRDNGQPEPSISSKRLQVILDEIDRMEKMLQGLLDFSRPAPMRKRMVDLRQVIRRTIELVNGRAKKSAIEIEVLRLDRALLMADEERLGHVLCNLLINAMDSIGESGKVTIELVCDEDTDRCQVRIADTVLESMNRFSISSSLLLQPPSPRGRALAWRSLTASSIFMVESFEHTIASIAVRYSPSTSP